MSLPALDNLVLITGGSGLLGVNWACAIRDRQEVLLGIHRCPVSLRGTCSVALDLDDPSRLTRQIEQLAPRLIVHTAGLASVDLCEKEPEYARKVNADYSLNIAHAAARVGAGLIHVSTDHLFEGGRSLYREEDTPSPLNKYGETKLLAEQFVAEAHPGALIVRTNFFGWGHAFRQSFSDWILANLSGGQPISMFDDVFFSPILADRLALAAHRLAEQGACGIYNIVGDERISKYEFALRLADRYGFSREPIRRSSIADANLPTKRPLDMSLDNSKARESLAGSLGTIADFLGELERQEKAGRRAEVFAAVSGE